MLLAAVGLWYFGHLVRQVDWPHVGASLARLSDGLGALDAAIVAILTGEGVTDTSAEVAALVVWRVCLLFLPLVLGLVGLLLWRRHGRSGPAGP